MIKIVENTFLFVVSLSINSLVVPSIFKQGSFCLSILPSFCGLHKLEMSVKRTKINKLNLSLEIECIFHDFQKLT